MWTRRPGAFRVFIQDIGIWWKPNAMFAFTPRDPGVLGREGGEGGHNIADAIFLRRHGERRRVLLGALNAFMRSASKGA